MTIPQPNPADPGDMREASSAAVSPATARPHGDETALPPHDLDTRRVRASDVNHPEVTAGWHARNPLGRDTAGENPKSAPPALHVSGKHQQRSIHLVATAEKHGH